MARNVDPEPMGGPRGNGRVEVLSPTSVKVTITDREKNTNQYIIQYPQGVSMVKIGEWQLQAVDNVFVQLTPDKEEILYIRPLSGKFYIQFAGFGAEPGQLPTIRFQEKREYQGRPWLPERYECYPLYEVIAGGIYSGMMIVDRITYEWEYDENLEEFAHIGQKPSLHEAATTFLNVFGFEWQTDNLHYTAENYDAGGPTNIANVLPELEDILKSRKKIAQVSVENGFTVKESLDHGPYGMTREHLEIAMSQQSMM